MSAFSCAWNDALFWLLKYVLTCPLLCLFCSSGPNSRGKKLSNRCRLTQGLTARDSCQKLNSLRIEADAAIQRAEAAEAKVKALEHDSLKNEQEIASLQHKLSVAEGQLESAEGKLTEHKSLAAEGESSKGVADNLSRKIALLESELDTSEKNLRETTEK